MIFRDDPLRRNAEPPILGILGTKQLLRELPNEKVILLSFQEGQNDRTYHQNSDLENPVGAPHGSRRGLEEALGRIHYSSGPEARLDARQGSEVQHCDGHGRDDDGAEPEGPEEC